MASWFCWKEVGPCIPPSSTLGEVGGHPVAFLGILRLGPCRRALSPWCFLYTLFLFPNFFAAICAGSLVAACSCDVTCFAINGDLGSGWCQFGAQNVSFGMPVAPPLAAWGAIERSRVTLDHEKGDVGIQAWTSANFKWISGPHLESCLPTLEQQMCFLSCAFTGHVS